METVPFNRDQILQWLSDPVNLGIVGGVLALWTLAWWSILGRAGFSGALALLMALPGVNLLFFLYFAFAPWPARGELSKLRKLETAVSKAERRYTKAA